MNGFLKLYRALEEWEWYTDTVTKVVFIHCLIKANWKDKKWRGKVIQRGSFITSYNQLALELNLTKKQIRGAITKLERTNEIEKKGTAYTHITVCKYDTYQSEIENQGIGGAQAGHTEGTERATTEEGKKERKKENNRAKMRFDEFWDAYALKKDRKKCEKKFNSLKESEQLKAIQHAKKYRDHHYSYGKIEYLPNPMTYLNNERWNDEQLPYEHLDEAVLPKKRTKEDEMAELRRMMG